MTPICSWPITSQRAIVVMVRTVGDPGAGTGHSGHGGGCWEAISVAHRLTPMRVRLPTRGPGGRPHLPYGMTPQTLLRGLVKLVAVVVAAALGGLAIGMALAKLSGNDNSSTSAAGGSPEASAPGTTATTRTSQKGGAPAQRKKPANDVRVRIVSAVLRSADTPSGRRRQRARLSVKVRVTNRGSRRVNIPRPGLVAGDARVRTDPNADSRATNVRALDPGASRRVTLRFELAGDVTKRVRQDRRARLIIAGQKVMAAVTLGRPISRPTATGGSTSPGTGTQAAPAP